MTVPRVQDAGGGRRGQEGTTGDYGAAFSTGTSAFHRPCRVAKWRNGLRGGKIGKGRRAGRWMAVRVFQQEIGVLDSAKGSREGRSESGDGDHEEEGQKCGLSPVPGMAARWAAVPVTKEGQAVGSFRGGKSRFSLGQSQ